MHVVNTQGSNVSKTETVDTIQIKKQQPCSSFRLNTLSQKCDLFPVIIWTHRIRLYTNHKTDNTEYVQAQSNSKCV